MDNVTYDTKTCGVFFDLDGTLVNTLEDIAGNLNQTRAYFKLKPLNTLEITGYIGRGVEHLIRNSFKDIDASNHGEVLRVMMQYYVDTPFHGGALYPNVLEVLGTLLSRDYILGIVTNKPTKAALSTVKHYLPNVPFQLVYGPEKVSAKKPDARHLLEAISFCKLDPKNCFYVGDDEVDFLTAEAAEVSFFGAGWGFGSVKKTNGKILQNFSDLPNFL